MPAPVRVALYGSNGHQIQRLLLACDNARLVAYAGIAPDLIPAEHTHARALDSLEAILADPAVDLISLCSPLRSEQARDAIRCLYAGKHVYAEKPSATSEADLDAIIAASKENGRRYHEQAMTAFAPPYAGMRRFMQTGALGEVVQIYTQKSYPWHDQRAQDERIDGGLLLQAGVYCTRFVEHIAGARISNVHALETKLSNPDPAGECRVAVSMMMTLANGGLVSSVVNYLCPPPASWHRWGYEILRVWGTRGMIESVDHGRVGTIAMIGEPPQRHDWLSDAASGPDLLNMVIDEIQGGRDVVPMSLEDELSPTRWVIRAKSRA